MTPHAQVLMVSETFSSLLFSTLATRHASSHPLDIATTNEDVLKYQELNDRPPPSPLIQPLPPQGGASGLEQEGDYIENKIARGIYGGTGKVFGAFGSVAHTAADEAKQANKAAKDAANKAARQARDSVKHVKDAARDAAKTARYCTHKCVLNFRSFIR